ncbi:MAG TPA: M15 family metallopeptidase [Alphaproteobacteria bacterium]|nr:M15 family metallopeptidase [Alphaproteobacteria bacterium]
MTFLFSKRSLKNLEGVHHDLVQVAHMALSMSPIDFVIIDGVRTIEEQRILVAKGKSKTMDSRHLTGHAIDIAAWMNGAISWDYGLYEKITDAFDMAAGRLKTPIVCGIDWPSFVDAGHIELDRRRYP